jgi:hypothetical protein
MPIKHPIDGEALYPVEEAASYQTALRLQTSVGALNSARSNGTGPRFLKIGKRIYYRESALRENVLSNITDEAGSTSEMKAARQLRIKDKSIVFALMGRASDEREAP